MRGAECEQNGFRRIGLGIGGCSDDSGNRVVWEREVSIKGGIVIAKERDYTG